MAFIFSNIPGLDHLMNYWYHFCIMFEALFIMTIIDAGTRVGRYMLQELIGRVWPKFGDPNWKPGAIIASALICGAWGYLVLNGNLSTICRSSAYRTSSLQSSLFRFRRLSSAPWARRVTSG